MSYQRPATYNLGPQLPQGPVFHNHHQQQQPHHRQADPPSSPQMSSSSASGYRLSGVRTGSNEPDTKREPSQQQQQATSAPHTYPSSMPPPNVQQPPMPFYPYPPYTSQSHTSQSQSQRLNDSTSSQQQFATQPSTGGADQHRMSGLKTETGGPPSLPVIYTQTPPMIVGASPPSSSTTLSSALSVPSSSADARSPADSDATSPGSAIATPDSASYSLSATPGSVPRLPPILQVEKVQVTTTATQAASASRRRNEAHFVCPVPGCGSTFTRRFNLRGHLRSHTEERPYVCEWPGCGKCFARQHDCKRHQALHSQRTQANVCQGCKKTFSRLDALNRHLRSDGGVECRVVHQQAGGNSGDGNSNSAGVSGSGADNSRLVPAAAVPNNGTPHVQQQSADHPNLSPTA